MATGVRPEKATTNFGADWNRPADGMKSYTINPSNNVHIYDNYGTEKSIFDPLPYGLEGCFR